MFMLEMWKIKEKSYPKVPTVLMKQGGREGVGRQTLKWEGVGLSRGLVNETLKASQGQWGRIEYGLMRSAQRCC